MSMVMIATEPSKGRISRVYLQCHDWPFNHSSDNWHLSDKYLQTCTLEYLQESELYNHLKIDTSRYKIDRVTNNFANFWATDLKISPKNLGKFREKNLDFFKLKK